MQLEKITLINFKNYASQTLHFEARLNAFVGLNGMGKTNLLDSIYYLCMCKSYFLPSDSDVILRGSDFLRLEGVFKKDNKQEKIVAKIQFRKKKIFERNDVAYSTLSEHIGLLPVVMITPDDTELVKEGSEERRRFLDNTLSQIDNQYLAHLIFYNRVLDQRNSTLKKMADTTIGKHNDFEDLLSVYETQMLPSAWYIFKKRREFVQQFEPIFNVMYGKISDQQEEVKIVYQSSLSDFGSDITQNKNFWKGSRDKDQYLQRTTVGIHRDDLSFEMGGKSAKKFGSQGQLKSFVVSLKLAQYEILRGLKTEPPILLLDDIFDKLDEHRVKNLLQLILNQSFGQIFISDTHEDRVKRIFDGSSSDFKIFYIENGICL